MKFTLRDIVLATTAVALLMSLARVNYDLFLFALLFANFFIFVGPIAILFTTIVFADQRGSYLELESNPFYQSLKRLWLLSAGCVAIVWTWLFVISNN